MIDINKQLHTAYGLDLTPIRIVIHEIFCLGSKPRKFMTNHDYRKLIQLVDSINVFGSV